VDLRRSPDIARCARRSFTTVPPQLAPRVHPLLKPLPLEVPHHLSTVRLVSRSRLPRVSLPFNDIPWTSPVRVEESSLDSVPLSGFWLASQRFPSRSKFRGRFSCHYRSWGSPFRVFPSQESRTPLGAASSLAVSHQPPGRHRSSLITAGFLDAHAHTQLPDSPDDYELPFHAPRRASRSLWARATEHVHSASDTHFEALILLRVRSHRPELPRADGRSSPELLPL
jgi:hypothetical protein